MKNAIAQLIDCDQPPWGLKYRSSNWFAVTTVTFAVFTDVRVDRHSGAISSVLTDGQTLLYGIIVPVIPFALQERVGQDHSGGACASA